ncbi:cysteine proteinase, partial [Ramaria rubella]
ILKYPPHEHGGVSITLADLALLEPGIQLNDSLVELCFQDLAHRRPQLSQRVHIFSPFFYSILRDVGYDSVWMWTRKWDLFDMDYLIIPIHQA